MSLPSSSCISLFSSRLLRTGNTFLSAFSIPSSTSTRPSKAARTEHCRSQRSPPPPPPPKRQILMADLVQVTDSPPCDLPPLLEVGLSGVPRQSHVLQLTTRQLAEVECQATTQGPRRSNQEHVLTQSILRGNTKDDSGLIQQVHMFYLSTCT